MKRYFQANAAGNRQSRRRKKHCHCHKKHHFHPCESEESVESSESCCCDHNESCSSNEEDNVVEYHVHCHDGHHDHCDGGGRELVDFQSCQQKGTLKIDTPKNMTKEEVICQVELDHSKKGDVVYLSGSIFVDYDTRPTNATLMIRKSNKYQDPMYGEIVYSQKLERWDDGTLPIDAIDYLSKKHGVVYTLILKVSAGLLLDEELEVSNTTLTATQYR
ncbi:hypothetical protein G4V62_02475 [Bacillaceae bacterium SIJ1]|uniref:hypothetical protein n=1 Tax=Litoribacterium kuwaitense TaxID=1398745 RepID=UPI0013EDA9FA|nr:hypothetical protein [Litoribacterium kuwaitense]NGP43866.1 hypothetical protein [Litoribacterium kuwaitense]